jgi:hypothetical protein
MSVSAAGGAIVRTIVPLSVLWRLSVMEARIKVLYRTLGFVEEWYRVHEISGLGGRCCDSSKAADSGSGGVSVGIRERRV